MSNNDLNTPFFFVGCLCLFGAFLYGHNVGYYNGKEITIKHCIEKPADCKVEYDYLKLQEKNK